MKGDNSALNLLWLWCGGTGALHVGVKRYGSDDPSLTRHTLLA